MTDADVKTPDPIRMSEGFPLPENFGLTNQAVGYQTETREIAKTSRLFG